MGLFNRRSRKKHSDQQPPVEQPASQLPAQAPVSGLVDQRGQNRINQRRATAAFDRDSQAIEKEMAQLSDRYEALTTELKDQLVADRDYEQRALTDLVDEQTDLKQRIVDVRAQTKAELGPTGEHLNSDQPKISTRETYKKLKSKKRSHHPVVEESEESPTDLTERLNHQKLNRLEHDLKQNQSEMAASRKRLASFDQKLQEKFGMAYTVSPVEFDRSANYFLFSTDLILALTADMRASMQSIMGFLADSARSHLNVITVNYNDDLPNIWENYHDMGLVSTEAGLYNLYYALQEKHPDQHRMPKVPNDPDWRPQRDADGRITVLKDKSDKPIMQIQYRPSGELWYITYLEDGQAHHRDVYDVAGNLSVTQYLDSDQHVSVVREAFYRPDGSVAIKKVYGPKHAVSVQLLSQDEQSLHTFKSELEFLSWWLISTLTAQKSVLAIGVDSPLFAPCVAYMDANFQVLPIISEADLDTAPVKAILAGKSPIKQVLAADEDVLTQLEKSMQHNLAISVIPAV